MTLKFTTAAKRKLRRARSVQLKVTVRLSGGPSTRKTVTLRR